MIDELFSEIHIGISNDFFLTIWCKNVQIVSSSHIRYHDEKHYYPAKINETTPAYKHHRKLN